VVLYDLRGTGGSFKPNWSAIFRPFKTTAVEEAKRVTGSGVRLADLTSRCKDEQALHAEIMDQLWDYDAHV